MSEPNRSDTMVTRASLAADLRAAGVGAGSVVLVHTSMSSLGWVCGGAVAVVQALQDAVTPAGTVAMPAQNATLTNPAHWKHPPVPEEWWPRIREEMPAYDPRTTPTLRMGAVAEAFRSFPDVLRSAHPTASFTAWGRHAAEILREHPLDSAYGDASPLARLDSFDATVLLLGCGHEANTSLHLAESRWGGCPTLEQGSPVLVDGRRVWATYPEFDFDADDFPAIGAAFAAAGSVRTARVGAATARTMRVREFVAFGVAWMRTNRRTA